jgi:hypothetical protein
MTESIPGRIDLTAPANYRILRTVLTADKPFTQLEIARATDTAPSHVSTVVRWLELHQHVVRRKKDARYEVSQPAGLIVSMLPYQRVMSRALVGTVKVPGSPKSVREWLSKEGATLCLESALEQYSGFFRGDRIAVYHPKPRALLAKLSSGGEGLLPVAVYETDIPLEGDQVHRNDAGEVERTSKFRTVVDLVCDNRAYAARDLFTDLWGVRIA